MKNKYIKRAKISEYTFRKVVRYFVYDLDITKISEILSLNRVTLNGIIQKIRHRLYELSVNSNPFFIGEIEVDESYFGARRVRGKRGRGASGKITVFGLLERKGKVYTQIVDDVSARTLLGIIRGKVKRESEIHSDYWSAYSGLVDLGYKKHYRVKHSANQFANGKAHINGIESFWSYAKRRMNKFNGIKDRYFDLHLKETEYRFNNRNKDLYKILLKEFREKPL